MTGSVMVAADVTLSMVTPTSSSSSSRKTPMVAVHKLPTTSKELAISWDQPKFPVQRHSNWEIKPSTPASNPNTQLANPSRHMSYSTKAIEENLRGWIWMREPRRVEFDYLEYGAKVFARYEGRYGRGAGAEQAELMSRASGESEAL
ncbi:hypothetical protein FRC12_002623 [Ceratobasidium sp. 428]|nr:hypothetical protein FRC12_002623 [Ceratobasidium sp. 428]